MVDRLGWKGYPPQISAFVVSSWDDMIGALMGHEFTSLVGSDDMMHLDNETKLVENRSGGIRLLVEQDVSITIFSTSCLF